MARCTRCNICQWLTACQWFSPGTPVSFTNKTDNWNIVESSVKHHIPTVISAGETRRQSRHNTENLHKAILKFKKHRRDRGSNEKEIRKNVNIENIKIQSGLERVNAEIPSDLLTRQEHQSSQPVFGQVSATYLFSFLCCVLLVGFFLWFFFAIVLCLVYPMLQVYLDCLFLISPSVFSNVYLERVSVYLLYIKQNNIPLTNTSSIYY